MNTVRTVVVVAVLAAVAYGVHASLTAEPPADPPGLEPGDWSQAPMVEIPSTPGTVTLPTAAPSGPPPISSAPASTPPPAAASVSSPSLDAGGEAPPFAAPAVQGKLDLAPPYQPPSTATPPPTTPESADTPTVSDAAPKQALEASPSVSLDAQPTEDQAVHITPSQSTPPPSASVPTDIGSSVQSAAGAAMPVEQQGAASSGHSADFETSLAEWIAELDHGNLSEAHLALSQWYGDPRMSEAQREQLLDLLDRVAGTVVYSQQSLLEPPYEVQPGDTLERIGQLYNVPWQLLAKINGISDPQRIRAGQTLKVVRGPFSAAVELDRYLLTLWLDGRYAGRFPVGVGQDHSTPEGEFIVRGKVENPTYYGPDHVIDADDPANPLGERWIDLGNQIGIHGTHEPESVGQASSRGCIRLAPRDVEDVFDILSVGSTIIIRR